MPSFARLFTASLACLAGLANAYTQPKGDAPEGNPFSAPGLNSVVPVGKEFTVTWTPTTQGSVTILLLKGPANNLAVVGPIAEHVPNSGIFYWVPATDLAPGQTGYGLQLIDDATGQYQYTTQFGIANPDYKQSDNSSSSSSSAPSSYVAASTSSSAAAPSSYSASSTSMSSTPSSTAASSSAPASSSASYSAGSGNGTVVTPTSPASTLYTSASAGASSTSESGSSGSGSSSAASATPTTNGASGLASSVAGLVVAAGVAVFAL